MWCSRTRSGTRSRNAPSARGVAVRQPRNEVCEGDRTDQQNHGDPPLEDMKRSSLAEGPEDGVDVQSHSDEPQTEGRETKPRGIAAEPPRPDAPTVPAFAPTPPGLDEPQEDKRQYAGRDDEQRPSGLSPGTGVGTFREAIEEQLDNDHERRDDRPYLVPALLPGAQRTGRLGNRFWIAGVHRPSLAMTSLVRRTIAIVLAAVHQPKAYRHTTVVATSQGMPRLSGAGGSGTAWARSTSPASGDPFR